MGFVLPYVKYGYPFGLNIAFSAIGFMFIGKCLFKLFQYIRSKGIHILVLILLITFIISLAAYFNVPDYGYILMADSKYNNPALFMIVALAGSGFIICIAILIEQIHLLSINKILQYIGMNSLAIMVLHKPVISVVERILNFISMPDVIMLITACFTVVVVCCGITWIINKVAPQIVGN